VFTQWTLLSEEDFEDLNGLIMDLFRKTISFHFSHSMSYVSLENGLDLGVIHLIQGLVSTYESIFSGNEKEH